MIVLQFACGTDFTSKAIDWFSHGWWSHVDAVLPDGRLLGARFSGGVAIRPADYLGTTKIQQVNLPCSDDMSAKFYEFLNTQVGKAYDKTAIAAFIFNRDWQNPKDWYCSELQASGLVTCGYLPHKLAIPNNKITPSDLYFLLSGLVDIPSN